MAEDKLPCSRCESMVPTRSDKDRSRSLAISFSTFQNASSRLTLVLWPATTTERLTTEDFIACPPARGSLCESRCLMVLPTNRFVSSVNGRAQHSLLLL